MSLSFFTVLSGICPNILLDAGIRYSVSTLIYSVGESSYTLGLAAKNLRYLPLNFVRFSSTMPAVLREEIISSIDQNTLDPALQNRLATLIQEQADGNLLIELPDGKGEKRILYREFIDWFRGFTDAEGCFSIIKVGTWYGFRFSILLHSDDVEVLNYIQCQLGLGSVKSKNTRAEVCFEVGNQQDLWVIIAIFYFYNLNTKKHLDFLAFARAFCLYRQNSDNATKKDINSEIEEIKSSMNSKRTNFDMANSHKFEITRSWLLGFTEGDGSFYCDRSSGNLIYQLTQKGNRTLMSAIQVYLNSLAPQDQFTINNAVNLYHKSNNDVWLLVVTQTAFLESVIIPLFNSRVFRTKKHLDYLDWLAIFNLQKKGLQFTAKGAKLIEEIRNQMNNNRLTENRKPRRSPNRVKLLSDITNFLALPSNYEMREDGKKWIISEGRFAPERDIWKGKAVTLLSTEGTIIETFKTVTACANFLGVNQATVSKRINKGIKFQYENKLCFIKKADNAEID